jgi:hypothetical protein
MATIIDYDPSEYKTGLALLQRYPNTWFYQRLDGKPHNVRDFSKCGDVLKINAAKQLEIVRPASAVYDKDWGAQLNPRVEIVPGPRLPKNVPLHVYYEITPLESGNMSSIVFQFMHHSPNKKTLPVFCFEMRNKVLRARWVIIKKDGTYSSFDVANLAPLKMGKTYKLDIYVLFSENANKGYIQVHLDGKKVWKRKAMTSSSNPQLVQLQFGLYGKPGQQDRAQVKRLFVKHVALPSAL